MILIHLNIKVASPNDIDEQPLSILVHHVNAPSVYASILTIGRKATHDVDTDFLVELFAIL